MTCAGSISRAKPGGAGGRDGNCLSVSVCWRSAWSCCWRSASCAACDSMSRSVWSTRRLRASCCS
eukprot:708267-Pyramimonas_sp.AAC.1